MKHLAQAVVLLFACAAHAAPSDVDIYAGYSLGVVGGPDAIHFDLPLPSEIQLPAGMQRPKVYADRVALAKPGTVTKCDLAEMGGPAFPSALVRLWLPEGEATRINFALLGWQRAHATDRALTFIRNGRLVHGHDPTLATISESMLYLHVGPKEEARIVLEAICGDA